MANKYQKEYEAYMKSIADAFAKICSYEGMERALVQPEDKISVMIYAKKEHLLEYDKELRHMYRRESENERTKKFQEERQKVAIEFLKENTITYDEWVEKHKGIPISDDEINDFVEKTKEVFSKATGIPKKYFGKEEISEKWADSALLDGLQPMDENSPISKVLKSDKKQKIVEEENIPFVINHIEKIVYISPELTDENGEMKEPERTQCMKLKKEGYIIQYEML